MLLPYNLILIVVLLEHVVPLRHSVQDDMGALAYCHSVCVHRFVF